MTNEANTPLFPLVLIGPMAAGKSHVGRRVARALEVPFIDTDSRITAEHGPISGIFDNHDEAYFRRLEREAVIDALGETAVVSLGGGAVLDPGTQADLAGHSVVYLSVTARAVQGRLGGGKRPLLANGLADWKRIYLARRAIYENLATIHFDTSHRTMDAIAADVVAWARERS